MRDTELHKIEQLKSDSLREIAKYLIKNGNRISFRSSMVEYFC
jgi:hypothetical protein